MAIYVQDENFTRTYYGSSWGDTYPAATITEKGKTLDLDSTTYWNDLSEQSNTYHVTWSISDSSIATISTSGLITPKTDGEVRVSASISGEYTESGNTVTAWATVVITGQSDDVYVSNITLVDPDGNKMDNAPYIIEDKPLDSTVLQFAALVELTDPVTGEKRTLDTRNGSISEQTDGKISDVEWMVGQAEIAYVDPLTGNFRPLEGGLVNLMVVSLAGMSGASVTASGMVRIIDPDGVSEEGYHPQDSLTVKVFYELYPPEDPSDPDDPNFVTSRTFSVSEVMSMGAVSGAYTAIGGGSSYYTITAEGVPLATILSAAGVNLEGIQSLEFGTADGYSQVVSYDYLFGPHYYYPNIYSAGVASSGAVPVYPILAYKSVQVKNGDTEPNYSAMSEASRFRLVTGAASLSDSSSNLQIKWIHTVYVRLKGAPAVQPDDGNGGGGTDGDGLGNGDGDMSGTGQGDGSTADDGVLAGETVSGSETVTAVQSLHSDDQASEEGDSQETSEGSGASQYQIFQVMNKEDSETDKTLEYENPYNYAAGVLGVGALVAGCCRSVLWYRRQMRPTVAASTQVV